MAALPSVAVIGVFLIVPICFIVAYSFMEADTYGGVRHIFSTEAYIQLLFERQLDDSLELTNAYLLIAWRSIRIAGLTTVATLIVSFPVAIWISMQTDRHRNLLILLVTIPFWANILIRTYSWILLLRETGAINTALIGIGLVDHPLQMMYSDGAVLVALVYTYAPFMVLPIYAAIERMDPRLLEAAYDLYSTRWAVLRFVIIPLAKPGIIAGCILTFVPCLGAMIAPELLGGGRNLMLGNLIYKQFTEFRNWPFGSALSLVLLCLVMICMMVYALLSRKKMAQGVAAR